MYTDKKVLLIAGGGTLGTYVAKELLRLGCFVDVICPEDKVSDHARLRFHQNYATNDFLKDLFRENHYHGIVNFLHYTDVEDYKEIYPLLIENTDHLIFLSSYRVYADEQHPITETAPRLYDVLTDKDFLENETYAVPKSKCEDFLTRECTGDAWTIVRPVISFSSRRLDLLLYSGRAPLRYAEEGKEMLLPETVRDYSAGIDWAGNSGKLIANLLFKPDAMGEIFTIYSGHGLTWGEVADIYADLTSVKIRWCSEEEYVDSVATLKTLKEHQFMWKYDRKFNRQIDPAKVLTVTGLGKEDFESVYHGLCTELAILKENS